MVPEAGIEPARLAAGDFESPASTNFTTRADCEDSDYDTFFFGFSESKIEFLATRQSGLKDCTCRSWPQVLGLKVDAPP